MRNPRHEHNITAKADRAIQAIDSLIERRLIDDTDFPEVTGLVSGREFMLEWLNVHAAAADEAHQVSAAWWVAVGIEHDRLNGVIVYSSARKPTEFNTSRQAVIDKLDALVWQATQPVPADPFAGLTGGPVPVEQPF